MAGNLPAPNTAQVKIVWAKSGTPYALNIMHFVHDVGASMTQVKAEAIDTLIKAAFASSGLNARIGTAISIARCETRHMDALSDPWFVGTGAAVAGTAAGDLLPDANCFAVTLKTGLRGRSYNGRVFLPGWTADSLAATGLIDDAAKTDAVEFVQTIMSDMASAQQFDLAVLSRWYTPPTAPPNTPPTERTPPVATAVTTVVALDNRFDVQRRRATPGI